MTNEETFYCSGFSHHGNQGTTKKCHCVECEPYRNRILQVYNTHGVAAAIVEIKLSTHKRFHNNFKNHVKEDLKYLREFKNERS